MDTIGKMLKFGLFILIFTMDSPVFSAILDAHKTVFGILNGENYSKDIRPFPTVIDEKYRNATVISVNMYIRKIDRIDDLKMEISTQMTFRQRWTDKRLEYHSNDTNLEYVTLNEEMADKIWSPHLFFSNEATAFVHRIMKTNSFKRVYPDGRVVWSTRITLVCSCPMDFRYFPFDSQVCTMAMSEYSHTKKEIAVSWDEDNPVLMAERKKLRYSRFDLEKIETGSCEVGSVAGEFSCIFVNFFLQRQSSSIITNLYMPCTMCVMLGWVSFWLGPSISARLSLTLTLLLTMTTQIQGANQNLPQVSYMKALDLWTGVCSTFGALSILLTATVAFVIQHDKKELELGNVFVNKKNDQNYKLAGYNSLARRIDNVCRILFPLSFFIFTAVYVFVYIIGENSIEQDYSVKYE